MSSNAPRPSGCALSAASEVGRTAVPRAPAFRRCASGSHRRDLPVGRIDDDRRAVLAVDFEGRGATVDPEIVVAADVAADDRRGTVRVARLRARLDALTLGALNRLCLFLGQREFPARGLRAFKRRQRGHVPGALQIGMAPGGPLGRPRFGARRAERCPGRQSIRRGPRRRRWRRQSGLRGERIETRHSALPVANGNLTQG